MSIKPFDLERINIRGKLKIFIIFTRQKFRVVAWWNLRNPARGGSTMAMILDFVALWMTGDRISSAFPTKNSQFVTPFRTAFSFAFFIASGLTSIPNTSPQCCNDERHIYNVLWCSMDVDEFHRDWNNTSEKQRPMVPVPQQTSSNVVSVVSSASSIAVLYRTSAPNVLTWKYAWGETRNFIPSSVSSMYSVPLTWYNVSLLSPLIPLNSYNCPNEDMPILSYIRFFFVPSFFFTHFLSIVWKYKEVTLAPAPFPVSKNVRSCDLSFSNSSLVRSWECITTINIKWSARVVRAVTCLQYPLWSTGLKGSKSDSRTNVSNIWNTQITQILDSKTRSFQNEKGRKQKIEIYFYSLFHIFRNVTKIVDRSNCYGTRNVTRESESNHDLVPLAVLTCIATKRRVN